MQRGEVNRIRTCHRDEQTEKRLTRHGELRTEGVAAVFSAPTMSARWNLDEHPAEPDRDRHCPTETPGRTTWKATYGSEGALFSLPVRAMPLGGRRVGTWRHRCPESGHQAARTTQMFLFQFRCARPGRGGHEPCPPT